jgi:PAS domain-containing protein
VLLLDPDLTVRSANGAFLATFSLPRDQVEGRSIFELPQDGHWDADRLRALLQRELPKNHFVQGYRVDPHDNGSDGQKLIANARRIRGEFGTPGVIVLSLGEGERAD